METPCRRILGLDYGSQRIGLSLSDPLCIIAQPFNSIKNDASLFAGIKKIVLQENVTLIVVGMPLNLKGQQAQQAERVRIFIDRLKKELGIEVVTWDERFTTTIAQQTMHTMGTRKAERQKKDGRIDSMAAAIMLQGFLDRRKRSSSG